MTLFFSPTGEVSVKENVQLIIISDYLAAFQNSSEFSDPLEELYDLYNDHIPFKAFKTWNDLVTLNKWFKVLCTKYDTLRDSELGRTLCAQLRRNLTRLNVVFERVYNTLRPHTSRLGEMETKVNQINAAIVQLKNEANVRVAVDVQPKTPP